MNSMQKLIDFLDKLEETKISYRLDKIRDAILVEVFVPGQHWEVEFFPDGSIEVEKFITGCKISGEEELEILFRDFVD